MHFFILAIALIPTSSLASTIHLSKRVFPPNYVFTPEQKAAQWGYGMPVINTDKPPAIPELTSKIHVPGTAQIQSEGYSIKPITPTPTQPNYKSWYLLSMLGQGGFGKVVLGHNGERYAALKFIDKRKDTSAIQTEVDIQWKLRAIPQVVQLLQYSEDDKFKVIVMEAANVGDLQSFIQKQGRIHGYEAQKLFKQLAKGLGKIHQAGYVMRDIKPANVLIFKESAGKLAAKYSDFGLSTKVNDLNCLACGTALFMPPEYYNNREGVPYDLIKADIYALGLTLLYVFQGSDPARTASQVNGRNVYSSKVSITSATMEWMGPEAVQLVDGMLKANPQERWSIQKILASPWLASV